MSTQWVAEMFPGEGTEYPSDDERDRADGVIAEWTQRWGEQPVTILRVHPDESDEGFANYLAGTPTNRAYMRSQLRRWWRRPGALASCPAHGIPMGPGGRCMRHHR